MDDIVIETTDGMVAPFDFSMINDGPVDEVFEEEVVEEVEVEEEIEEEEVVEEEVVEAGEGSEEEVDYESYEITLPSGESVVMSDLVTGYKAAEEVRAEKEQVEALKKEFLDKSGGLMNMLALAQLEVDTVIQEYEDTDWEEMANEDPAVFTQHRQYLDKNVKRSEELKRAVQKLNDKKAEEAQQVEQTRIREATVRLQREITGWGDPKYYSLIEYGVEIGGNRDELLGCTDPIIFLALHRAQEAEKGKQAIKAKVKVVGSPRKVVKAAPKGASISEDAKRDAIIKKAQAEGDMASLFHLIKD